MVLRPFNYLFHRTSEKIQGGLMWAHLIFGPIWYSPELHNVWSSVWTYTLEIDLLNFLLMWIHCLGKQKDNFPEQPILFKAAWYGNICLIQIKAIHYTNCSIICDQQISYNSVIDISDLNPLTHRAVMKILNNRLAFQVHSTR